MRPDLIAWLQTEAYLQSVFNVSPHIAIQDARINLDVVLLSTNALSILPVAYKALVSSGTKNALTSINYKIIKIRDLDGESDSDFSIKSRVTLD